MRWDWFQVVFTWLDLTMELDVGLIIRMESDGIEYSFQEIGGLITVRFTHTLY